MILTPFAPQFIGMLNLVAAHQDFLSLVIADKPVRAGEEIHLWMTRLGGGHNPPAQRPTVRLTPLERRTLPAGALSRYRFGLLGFYQVHC